MSLVKYTVDGPVIWVGDTETNNCQVVLIATPANEAFFNDVAAAIEEARDG